MKQWRWKTSLMDRIIWGEQETWVTNGRTSTDSPPSNDFHLKKKVNYIFTQYETYGQRVTQQTRYSKQNNFSTIIFNLEKITNKRKHVLTDLILKQGFEISILTNGGCLQHVQVEIGRIGLSKLGIKTTLLSNDFPDAFSF